ncbi:hypothetical protein [Streptomyces sp. NPDC088350]|uniref:hypothetical protein n=1 Tax=Streptomyces sp. NPDC088350 TaxID=3365854 RepID=UPI0037F47A1C
MTVFGVLSIAVLVPLVVHDLSAARRVGGRVPVVREGPIVEKAPAEKVVAGSARPATQLPTASPGDSP